MSASSHVSDHAQSDASLLREFVQSGSRAAFTEMVARYSGLVFAAAQRITGDRSMAEEAVQNVFAILARKASAVARLPHIAGWLHQTAVFEARKRLRSETRHRRKLAALSEQMSAPAGSGPEIGWDEILPHVDECIQRLRSDEQRAIRMRYLEERSYADIGAALGKSEEAGKKQTARAMERLCLLLRRRGIVNVSVLGAMLSAGARTASAMPAGALATAALGAAQSLSRSALFTHALHTMSTARIVLSAAAFLALSAAPVLWQESAIARTREEVVRAGEARGKVAEASPVPVAMARATPAPPATSSTADDEPLTVEVLADLIEQRQSGRLAGDSLRQFRRAEALEPPELFRFLTESGTLASPVTGGIPRREQVQLWLIKRIGARDSAAGVKAGVSLWKEMSENGLSSLEMALDGFYKNWLKTDLRAALESFETLRSAGAFQGRGIEQTGWMLAGKVVGECYAFSREDALRLYPTLDDGARLNAIMCFVGAPNPADLPFIVEEAMKHKEFGRRVIFGGLLAGEAKRNGPDAAATMLKELALAPDLKIVAVSSMLSDMTSDPGRQPVAEALAWAKKYLSPEECAAAAGRWLDRSYAFLPGGEKERNEIVREFDWGPARDTAIAALFKNGRGILEPGGAASLAMEIKDQTLKVDVLRRIAKGGGTRSRAFTDVINAEPTLTSEERLSILKP